ncbi:MAG TPA: hypothetical protein VGL07_17085 [Buttiauxella sp.]
MSNPSLEMREHNQKEDPHPQYVLKRQLGELPGDGSPALEEIQACLAEMKVIQADITSKAETITSSLETIQSAVTAAQGAAESITGMRAVAATLNAGEEATASFDADAMLMTFGIPKGESAA